MDSSIHPLAFMPKSPSISEDRQAIIGKLPVSYKPPLESSLQPSDQSMVKPELTFSGPTIGMSFGTIATVKGIESVESLLVGHVASAPPSISQRDGTVTIRTTDTDEIFRVSLDDLKGALFKMNAEGNPAIVSDFALSVLILAEVDVKGLHPESTQAIVQNFVTDMAKGMDPGKALSIARTQAATGAFVDAYMDHEHGFQVDQNHIQTGLLSELTTAKAENPEGLVKTLAMECEGLALEAQQARKTGNFDTVFAHLQTFHITLDSEERSPVLQGRKETRGALIDSDDLDDGPPVLMKVGSKSAFSVDNFDEDEKASEITIVKESNPLDGIDLVSSRAFLARNRITAPLPDGFMNVHHRCTIDDNGIVCMSGSGKKASMVRESITVHPSSDEFLLDLRKEARRIGQKYYTSIVQSDSSAAGDAAIKTIKRIAQLVNVTLPKAKYDYKALKKGWVDENRGRAVTIKDVADAQVAVCRHRATLFALLAHEAGLDSVTLVGGRFKSNRNPDGGAHQWNEVHVGENVCLVDLEQREGKDHCRIHQLKHQGTRATYVKFDGKPWYSNKGNVLQ